MNSHFREALEHVAAPYIIAEIGSNHNGDMQLAKKLIDSACECGCDAVKFQSWTPTSLIAKEEYERNIRYNDSPHKHFGSLQEMVEKYYLRREQHIELKEYCTSRGIDFCSSPFSFEEVDLLVSVGVPFIKIASMDINNLELIKYAARCGKPILLSTGMATLAEIDQAVKAIEQEKNSDIVLLHCISIYPPRYEDINLRNISMLRQTFGHPVGFSDHSLGISIPLASVAIGACLIEKHFTIDKTLPGWDHEISANPAEMQQIVSESKKVFQSLGRYRRTVSDAEEQKKIRFRRSIVVRKDLSKGHTIAREDIEFKRPGTGIRPDEIDHVIGKTLRNSLKADQLLRWEDLS